MAAEPHRKAQMTALADLHTGVGLEIGPLHRTIVDKDEFDVRYVDVFDTASIRDHYRDDPAVDINDIPELDYWLRTDSGEILGLDEAAKGSAPYSWVVASHVIEHVPDIIGWLGQLAVIMDDDASLVLCIPDRRFTFDALRPPTTIGQMLEANNGGDRVPSIRAVYDHTRNAVYASAQELWAGGSVSEQDRIHDLGYTLSQLAEVRDEGHYVDCHVWLFTPAEFAAQIDELGQLKVIDFYTDRIVPTERDGMEFFAVLKRLPRNLSTEEADRIRAASILEVVDPPNQAVPADQHDDAETATPAQPGQAVSTPGAQWFQASDREVRLIATKRRVVNFLLRRQ
jgi:Methyltransferase domain